MAGQSPPVPARVGTRSAGVLPTKNSVKAVGGRLDAKSEDFGSGCRRSRAYTCEPPLGLSTEIEELVEELLRRSDNTRIRPVLGTGENKIDQVLTGVGVG